MSWGPLVVDTEELRPTMMSPEGVVAATDAAPVTGKDDTHDVPFSVCTVEPPAKTDDVAGTQSTTTKRSPAYVGAMLATNCTALPPP